MRPAATAEQARSFLGSMLIPLWRVMPNAAMYQRAIEVRGHYGFSFYGSLIEAAAPEAGCSRLSSEDL